MPTPENPDATEEYVLLPTHGLRAARANRGVEMDFLTRLGGARSTEPPLILSATDFFSPIMAALDLHLPGGLPPGGLEIEPVEIIDSVHEDGPKLVRMTHAAAEAFDLADTGLRRASIRYYEPAQSPGKSPSTQPPLAANRPAIVLSVVCASTGQAIPGVKVVAYTSLAQDEGATGVTDAAGQVSLQLGGNPVQLESLYVQAPSSGHWGFHSQGRSVGSGAVVRLAEIVSTYTDGVRQSCRPFSATDGGGVRVAVIDSGIGPHPDLSVVNGRNTVLGEPRGNWQDSGLGHGTHVAGIIACDGAASGLWGIAPNVQLWSGRVYGAGADRATNYSIMKAMILAADDNCDLLNLSLAADTNDPVLQEAVTDAAAQGCVVFAATGNAGASRLSWPAGCVNAVAISAFGVAGSYPADTPHDLELGNPRNGQNHFATFSNWGPGVAFIGPGVGIISASPNGGYGVRSGTSMACAAATGLAARLLGRNPALLSANRDLARAAAIQNMLHGAATPFGFGFKYEGAGRL